MSDTATDIPGTTSNLLLEELLASGVLRLTLANPPAHPLSLALIEHLQSALDRAENNAEVRVIIIASTGVIFCAGHDLKEVDTERKSVDRGQAFFQQLLQNCARMMQTIVNHPKPVIAEVDGLATGAGCQLVASCDLAIVSDEATFCTPGVHIGLFCSTPMVAISRKMHKKHVMEMLLLGEAIDASAAREYGLINRVVPKKYLRQVCEKYAAQIASKSSHTLKIGKQAFYAQAEMPLAQAYEYTSKVMAKNMAAKDAEEGIGAFIEHRDPVWRDE